jgi:hypothetical protein
MRPLALAENSGFDQRQTAFSHFGVFVSVACRHVKELLVSLTFRGDAVLPPAVIDNVIAPTTHSMSIPAARLPAAPHRRLDMEVG